MLRHDVVHVVFGLGTTLKEEALADTWSMFGTTMGFREYLSYLKTDEAKKIIEDVGAKRMFVSSILAIPIMCKAIYLSRKMKKKWVFTNFEEYLQRPLNQIRAEFGVHLVVSYLSIGESEEVRWYFSDLPKSLKQNPNPDWPDNYRIPFWESKWQQIILGSKNSSLGRIQKAGFDGVYLDIVDGFENFPKRKTSA